MKTLELPTKIYFTILDMGSGYVYTPSLDDNGGTEYIRKDISNEAIQVAEDHAYFAGQEKLREKLLEWAKEAHDSGPIKDSADKGDAWSIGYLCGMRDIIDKLNSL